MNNISYDAAIELARHKVSDKACPSPDVNNYSEADYINVVFTVKIRKEELEEVK